MAEGVEYRASDAVRFYAEPWYGYVVELSASTAQTHMNADFK